MRALSSPWLLVLLLTAATYPALAAEPTKPAPPTEEITVIGRRPVAPVTPNTSYWVEDGFTTYPLLGPNFAKGLIIWNHQESFDGTGSELPPIKVMEGLAGLGWDIVRLQRNSRLKTGFENKMADVRDALAKQLASAKIEGYQRVILAGQQVGGALALEAGKEVEGIYAIVAFAPNPGILWMGNKRDRSPMPIPTDEWAGMELERTWDQLSHTRAGRLFILFPGDDEEVPHERGPTTREILSHRDMPFLLVDETSGVRTTHGADTPDFSAYASCMDLFLSPELTPHPGEFHCGADEIPAALAQMGVKPGRGETWFGYSSRGQAIYLELPADGRGSILYGWGVGANAKIRAGVKALEAKFEGETFTANLTPDQVIHGVRHDPLYRLTIDQEDGTRASVALHRLAGNS
jgi:hypothetical protein